MMFLAFIAALFVTMALIPPLVRGAPRLQLVDTPNERKVHAGAVPRVGGLAMFLGFLIPVLLWADINSALMGYLLGAAVILAFGLWDDRTELGYRCKFTGQIAAVLIVMMVGGVQLRILPFGGLEPVTPWVSAPLTFIALLGITNAVNLSDGLDGLAGGLSLLSVFVIALLAYLGGDTALLMIALALGGALLGFLRFNTHPAQLFMGDAGSQFLGYSLGVMVILLTQSGNTALSPALPLLILGLPIIDTLLVMIQRIRQGRSPFSPDKNHTHHKLLQVGFSHHEAVIIIYSLQAAMVTAAFFLRYHSDAVVVGVFMVFCVVTLGGLSLARQTGWRMHPLGREIQDSELHHLLAWLYTGDRIGRWTGRFLALLVFVYLFAAAALAGGAGFDIGLLALGALAVLLLLYPRHRGRPLSWIEKGGVFLTCAVLVYLAETSNGFLEAARPLMWTVIALLAVGMGVGLRFATKGFFRFTTLDFLIVLFALVVPSLPMLRGYEAQIGFGVTSMIVLFYTIEFLLASIDQHWDLFRLAFYTMLAIIGLRALW